MYEFISLDIFDSCMKKYKIPDDILFETQRVLIEDLYCGDMIEKSGGAYKVRVGSKDKGKRGGYRVIYAPKEQNGKVFLFLIYPKNKKSNLTPKEVEDIAKYKKELFGESYWTILEEVGMSFYEDLKEAYRQMAEYEKNGTCGRVLEPIVAFQEDVKIRLKESACEKTALVIKPNGKASVIHTNNFSTNEELIEEYETYGHKVISIYDGCVDDSKLMDDINKKKE